MACSNTGSTTPCSSSADCPSTEPYCDPAIGGCRGCEIDDQCAAYPDTPLCNADNGQCVECIGDSGCSDGTPKCDVSTNTCVECLDDAECTDASAAQCDSSGSCAPCTENTHCDSIPGKLVCGDGECVKGCTVATEAADCGNNSCDPATLGCTDTERGSVNVCGSCLADSECGDAGDNESDDYRCIELDFMGASQGGKCLQRRAPGMGLTCASPFATFTTRESLSGAADAEYCGIRQDLTTCEASNASDQGAKCPMGASIECAPNGALCETIRDENRCTYRCEFLVECPSGLPACPIALGFCTVPAT